MPIGSLVIYVRLSLLRKRARAFYHYRGEVLANEATLYVLYIGSEGRVRQACYTDVILHIGTGLIEQRVRERERMILRLRRRFWILSGCLVSGEDGAACRRLYERSAMSV